MLHLPLRSLHNNDHKNVARHVLQQNAMIHIRSLLLPGQTKMPKMLQVLGEEASRFCFALCRLLTQCLSVAACDKAKTTTSFCPLTKPLTFHLVLSVACGLGDIVTSQMSALSALLLG